MTTEKKILGLLMGAMKIEEITTNGIEKMENIRGRRIYNKKYLEKTFELRLRMNNQNSNRKYLNYHYNHGS